MKKYPSLNRYGEDGTKELLTQPVTVLEKMDGANFRFCHSEFVDKVEEDRIVFGSRNVIYKNEKDTDKSFEHAVETVRDTVPTDALNPHVTVFAEAMHPHTLDYDWDATPSVLVFDAWDERQGWLPWEQVQDIAVNLGLDTVPVISEDETYETIDDVPTEFDSRYGSDVPEGVVIRRSTGEGSVYRAKYRTEAFLDRHESASKSDTDHSMSETEELAYELLSLEPWVEKQIHKYEDRGRDIEMGIMEDLWRDVFDDIIEEEYETVFLGDYTLNTTEFRSVIASHTAEVLQQYIRRPDESVFNEVADT